MPFTLAFPPAPARIPSRTRSQSRSQSYSRPHSHSHSHSHTGFGQYADHPAGLPKEFIKILSTECESLPDREVAETLTLTGFVWPLKHRVNRNRPDTPGVLSSARLFYWPVEYRSQHRLLRDYYRHVFSLGSSSQLYVTVDHNEIVVKACHWREKGKGESNQGSIKPKVRFLDGSCGH